MPLSPMLPTRALMLAMTAGRSLQTHRQRPFMTVPRLQSSHQTLWEPLSTGTPAHDCALICSLRGAAGLGCIYQKRRKCLQRRRKLSPGKLCGAAHCDASSEILPWTRLTISLSKAAYHKELRCMLALDTMMGPKAFSANTCCRFFASTRERAVSARSRTHHQSLEGTKVHAV